MLKTLGNLLYNGFEIFIALTLLLVSIEYWEIRIRKLLS